MQLARVWPGCLLLVAVGAIPAHAQSPVTTTTLPVPASSAPAIHGAASSPVDEAAQEALLQQAAAQINAGESSDAIDGALAHVIQTYENAYAHSNVKLYCAQSGPEALLYMLIAAKSNQSARVLDKPTWALAYYLRGYAYGDLGDSAKAVESLKQALELSPSNSQFLSELGDAYEHQKDWANAVETFQNAYAYAEFADADAKVSLQCHALRGQGYVLVEQHKLDEAKRKYRDCLKINPGDQKSLGELDYIKGLLDKSAK